MVLCRLDEIPVPRSALERRREERWEYRMSDIAVLVAHPGGGSGRFLVCSRNLSAGGMGFIHGGYLHPGSDCRIALTRPDGSRLAVEGVVAHCRHVEGPHHEIGIRFQEQIGLGGGRGQLVLQRAQADLGAGAVLAPHVDLGRRVFPDPHGRQTGRATGQRLDGFGHFLADFV